MIRALTKSETYLLEWLRRQEKSTYVECQGPVLDELLALGLVSVERPRGGAQKETAEVRLTERGQTALNRGSIRPTT
jgi:hypothetical protein